MVAFSGRFIERDDYKVLLEREGFLSRKSAMIRLWLLYSFVIITLLLVILILQMTSNMILSPLDNTMDYETVGLILVVLQLLLLSFGIVTVVSLYKIKIYVASG